MLVRSAGGDWHKQTNSSPTPPTTCVPTEAKSATMQEKSDGRGESRGEKAASLPYPLRSYDLTTHPRPTFRAFKSLYLGSIAMPYSLSMPRAPSHWCIDRHLNFSRLKQDLNFSTGSYIFGRVSARSSCPQSKEKIKRVTIVVFYIKASFFSGFNSQELIQIQFLCLVKASGCSARACTDVLRNFIFSSRAT